MSNTRQTRLWEIQRLRLRSWDGPLIGILMLAAFTRCYRPGLYQLVWDEVNILYQALRLARYGQWTWLSNRTSWEVIPGHSPLNNYLIALPYLLTTDPRAARLLVGVLGVLAVGITYLMVKRYFGREAAILSGLLLAIAAPAVEWSRFVWNPNLAQPFLALWIVSGLLGYHEGRRWAQTWHWPALSLAIQTNIGNVLIGPLSLLLLAVGWFRPDRDRRTLARHTLLGWALAALSLLPWAIGLVQAGFPYVAAEGAPAPPPVHTLEEALNSFSNLTGATFYWNLARGSASPGNWWPPAGRNPCCGHRVGSPCWRPSDCWFMPCAVAGEAFPARSWLWWRYGR